MRSQRGAVPDLVHVSKGGRYITLVQISFRGAAVLPYQQQRFMETQISDLSSREAVTLSIFARGSEIKRIRPAVPFCPSDLTAPNKSHRPPPCHPDRSVAEWRDLLCAFLPNKGPVSSQLLPRGFFPTWVIQHTVANYRLVKPQDQAVRQELRANSFVSGRR